MCCSKIQKLHPKDLQKNISNQRCQYLTLTRNSDRNKPFPDHTLTKHGVVDFHFHSLTVAQETDRLIRQSLFASHTLVLATGQGICHFHVQLVQLIIDHRMAYIVLKEVLTIFGRLNRICLYEHVFEPRHSLFIRNPRLLSLKLLTCIHSIIYLFELLFSTTTRKQYFIA